MIKPVFVAGNNRSGTKWLSNILLNNPHIAGVQSQRHHGIVETNIFQNFPLMFGELENMENYIGFVECFSATDFFKITGLSKGVLYQYHPKDYADFFRYLMNRYAGNQETDFWLQKIQSILLSKIYIQFNDARFIIIKRNAVKTIRSACVLQKRKGAPSRFAKEILIYCFSTKIWKTYRKKENVMTVTYEELLSDQESTVQKICRFIEVPFSHDMLNSRYKKNTSFESKSEKESLFPKYKAFIVKIVTPILSMLPLFFFEYMFKLKKFSYGEGMRFIGGTFSLAVDDFGINKE